MKPRSPTGRVARLTRHPWLLGCVLAVLALGAAYAAWVARDLWGAAQAIDAASAASAEQIANAPLQGHPPIPIHFKLSQPGYVTLVIEKPDGTRVRNLVSETQFPAGENTAWWDGLDDLGRDADAATHGQYGVPGRLVAPGTYRVRGLVRPALRALYEFSPYDPGQPPWKTADRSSEWLANHSAPSAVLFVPPADAPARPHAPATPAGQVLVGSYVSEGGSGLTWLAPDGRKLWGQMWVGGVWTGATQLALDTGAQRVPGVYAYTASSWRGDQPGDHYSELRLDALLAPQAQRSVPADARLGSGDDEPVLSPPLRIDEPQGVAKPAAADPYPERRALVAGLAARDGLVAVALRDTNQLLFVDAAQHRVLDRVPLADPRGLAFDAQGHLLALSGHQLLRLDLARDAAGQVRITGRQIAIAEGLDDPQAICLDATGAIYVSDWGNSHQVKVFAPNGKPARTIGHAGAPAAGVYDPSHMNHPAGITIDGQGRLWVAENDKTPKRVSVWDSASGRFVDAFYGPPRYGGGGTLDPRDPTRFYYADEAGGTTFKLDWSKGTSTPLAVYYRADADNTGFNGTDTGGAPDYPLYRDKQRYLTNAFSAQVTGRPSAILWQLGADEIARPVAAAGSTSDATGKPLPVFADPAMRARMPPGSDPEHRALLFLWRDANGDHRVEPNEVTFWQPQGEARGNAAMLGNVTVLDDLSFAFAYAGRSAVVVPATGIASDGVPLYDLDHQRTLATDVQAPVSTGGGQVLVGRNDWTVFTTPPAPFAPQGVAGMQGEHGARWSYPSLWPGLHASHAAPVPSRPGELIGTTRVLGNPIDAPAPSDVGQLWAINGNEGDVYMLTTDGLFVATLFKDARLDTAPPPHAATRGLDLGTTSLGFECFHPSLTRGADGRVYMQAGSTSPLLRITGLEDMRRLPDQTITVTAADLVAAQQQKLANAEREAAARNGERVLNVAVHGGDESAQNWPNGTTQWAKIDTRSAQVGDWGHKDAVTSGSLAVFGDQLVMSIRTDNPDLLANSGESLQNLFATGGGIDLMLGVDPAASAGRTEAARGDERLVVSRVNGATVAMLYRPVAATAGLAPVSYSSPLRTIRFDRVDNLSNRVALDVQRGGDGTVTYKVTVPLKLLDLNVSPGMTIAGDIGVLRGNGFETLQRAYWSNKAGGLVSDLPGEAELTPNLWGRFRFVSAYE